LVLVVAVLEAGLYAISRFIPLDWYYAPPTREQFERYLESPRRDPLLGWKPPAASTRGPGYREAPAGRVYPRPCLSVYGDSFTYAMEVSADAAWPNLLTDALGCRVDNYGVPGYGTAQAFLRFHYNSRDSSPLIMLLHTSENITRNINQEYTLLYGNGIALKPRFVLDAGGRLKLIDTPRLAPDQHGAYVSDLSAFLSHEYFLPNAGLLSKRTLGFPYLVRVPYVLTWKRIWSAALSMYLPVAPWYAELYDPGHPSRALPLTAAILQAFVAEAEQRGKRALLAIVPTVRDLNYRQSAGNWPYQPLLDQSRARGIEVLNVGSSLLAKTEGSDLCDYFCSDRVTRTGHYTEAGNRLIAEVVAAVIGAPGRRGMTSVPP
jgi:hypothetical protein